VGIDRVNLVRTESCILNGKGKGIFPVCFDEDAASREWSDALTKEGPEETPPALAGSIPVFLSADPFS
jgi:hypothetical protein